MSEPQTSDPHNHLVPVYEILQLPLDDNVLLVVMLYLTHIDRVRFTTVGEAVECFWQLLEVCVAFVSILQLQVSYDHAMTRAYNFYITTILHIGEYISSYWAHAITSTSALLVILR